MAKNRSKGKSVKEHDIVKKFKTVTEEAEIKPNYLKNSIMAFLVGGTICLIGQIIRWFLIKWGLDEETVKSLLPAIMIFLGAFLTGIGIYDKIADYGGAGTVVPITGFSNAIVSPAMEFKKEGFIFGVAAKMFIIAGPVLVYGIGSSVILGLIYYITKMF